MMKKRLIVLLAALASSSSTALADSTGDTMHSRGVYVTLGAGMATTGYSGDLEGYSTILGMNSSSPKNSNLGGRASLGYVWTSNFDTEFSYYAFSGPKVSGNNSKVSVMQRAVALTAVGRVPVENSGSDFYAKAGLAYTWVNMKANSGDTTQNDAIGSAVPLLGLGYELNIGHNWAMSAEFIKVFPGHKNIGDVNNTKMADASLYSIGATYKF